MWYTRETSAYRVLVGKPEGREPPGRLDVDGRILIGS
jgi:hypothetical protein